MMESGHSATDSIELGGEKMKTKNLIKGILASFMLVGFAFFPPANAEEYVLKAVTKKLHQAPLHGVDGKEMTVIHADLPPKFVGGKHIHPGPVFVYVLEGELTVNLGGETKTFKAGELYAEDINTAMVGENTSSSDDLEILIFQVGDIGKPMMIKVE
jgi:quercetin dioxygenase-like cupin family protein